MDFCNNFSNLLFIGFYLFNISYSTPSGRKFFDNLILKIPLFGDLILKSELASMSDTLSTLINSGISIVEAIEKCINASSNEIIKISLRRSISLVTQGQELKYIIRNIQSYSKITYIYD